MGNFKYTLEKVHQAHKAHEQAITIMDAAQTANNGQTCAAKDAVVSRAAGAVGAAERELMATAPQSPVDALRKVLALLCEGMTDQAIASIRADAERLTDLESDPIIRIAARCEPLRAMINSADSNDPLVDDMIEELQRLEGEALKHVPTTPAGLAALANLQWKSEGPCSHFGSPDWHVQMQNPSYVAMLNLRTGARLIAGEAGQ